MPLVLMAIVAVGGLVAAERMGYHNAHLPHLGRWLHAEAASPPSPTALRAPAAARKEAPPAAAAAPPAQEAAEKSSIPEGMGLLKTTDLAGQRRIFVDNLTVGQTPDSVLVKCGSRTVRIGSAGHPQVIDIPCGGEISVGEH
jgi:hypothetical protein